MTEVKAGRRLQIFAEVDFESETAWQVFTAQHKDWKKYETRMTRLTREIGPGDVGLGEFIEVIFELARQERLKDFAGH